jgi:hypothetical protein
MATTFRVDSVKPELSRLATRTLTQAITHSTGRGPLATSPELTLVEPSSGLHPLVQAVHLAFSEHRPLVWSPDHVWLTLAQGFALHVEENAEALRDRFVRHQGRAPIAVPVMALPRGAEEWAAVVNNFGQALEAHVGPGLHHLFTCTFSTTTQTERIASQVVMMSAFRRYFDYQLRCICGIPEITLEGTVADWAELRRRAEVLAEYELEWWVRGLRPILAKFEATAAGRPDPDFWECIYKPKEVYGGEVTTGWLMRLFPYLQPESGLTYRNPMVLAAEPGDTRDSWIGSGLAAESAPLGLSSASLRVQGVKDLQQVSLYGGLVGVQQLPNGALRPAAAWAVAAPTPMATLLQQIDQHAPRPKPTSLELRGHGFPAALIELYDHCDGAVLFGRWDLLRRQDLQVVVGSFEDGFYGRTPGAPQAESYEPDRSIPVLPFCALQDDPRYFALYEGDELQVVLIDPRRRQTIDELLVVEGGVQVVLTKIFENRGENWLNEITGSSLYHHLPHYHSYLRPQVLDPSGPPPLDLDRRELEQLILRLAAGEATSAQREGWWAMLQSATGTDERYEDLFGRRIFRRKPTPFEIMERLGLRPSDD